MSNLIKEATGMTDAEYLDFITKYENKPFTEIYPIELRNKVIEALATINSNVRKGERAYNEMYGSNPGRVMGVFAYSENQGPVGNVFELINRRPEFLRRYAIERDIPYIVFGD